VLVFKCKTCCLVEVGIFIPWTTNPDCTSLALQLLSCLVETASIECALTKPKNIMLMKWSCVTINSYSKCKLNTWASHESGMRVLHFFPESTITFLEMRSGSFSFLQKTCLSPTPSSSLRLSPNAQKLKFFYHFPSYMWLTSLCDFLYCFSGVFFSLKCHSHARWIFH